VKFSTFPLITRVVQTQPISIPLQYLVYSPNNEPTLSIPSLPLSIVFTYTLGWLTKFHTHCMINKNSARTGKWRQYYDAHRSLSNQQATYTTHTPHIHTHTHTPHITHTLLTHTHQTLTHTHTHTHTHTTHTHTHTRAQTRTHQCHRSVWPTITASTLYVTLYPGNTVLS
jgi:hypothetical protein